VRLQFKGRAGKDAFALRPRQRSPLVAEESPSRPLCQRYLGQSAALRCSPPQRLGVREGLLGVWCAVGRLRRDRADKPLLRCLPGELGDCTAPDLQGSQRPADGQEGTDCQQLDTGLHCKRDGERVSSALVRGGAGEEVVPARRGGQEPTKEGKGESSTCKEESTRKGTGQGATL